MLGLRTVNKNRQSYNGFQYPPVGGTAIAPDWDGGKPECGGGLHFLPWGEGDSGLIDGSSDVIWQVVDDKNATDTVVFDGKAKTHSLKIVFEGNRKEATDYLLTHGVMCKSVAGATVVSGDFGTSISGDYGESTSGKNGISMSGNKGTSISGYQGTLIISYFDGKRIRIVVEYVGENGIEANVAYKLDENGKFVKA